MKKYTDIPQILRDFLTYHENIKGQSPRTIAEYYLDLRMFLRFIKLMRYDMPINSPLEDIPIKDIDIDDNAFKNIEAIIHSMTPKERANPDIINTSRKERIARGSGTTLQEVNRLMKQFDQIRKTMKSVAGGKMPNLMPRGRR